MAHNSNFFRIDFGLVIVNKYLRNYKIQLEPKGFYIEELNYLVMTIHRYRCQQTRYAAGLQ